MASQTCTLFFGLLLLSSCYQVNGDCLMGLLAGAVGTVIGGGYVAPAAILYTGIGKLGAAITTAFFYDAGYRAGKSVGDKACEGSRYRSRDCD